jgi:hypothetical protein
MARHHLEAHNMTAPRSPFLVIGAIPAPHASDRRQAALPVERRITFEPDRIADRG